MPVRSRFAAATALCLLLAPARGLLAHHSVAGEFDVHRIVQLSGVVAKVDWANPHIYLHLAVRDAHGGVADWRLESVPVAMMRKAGLSKVLLLGNGQPVTADVYLARDGTPNLGYLVKITYADGHHYQFAPDR